MLRPRTLADYPYVRVRLRCAMCHRSGSYRLVRLAARFGAEIELDELVERLTVDCGVRRTNAQRGGETFYSCQARLVDLQPPQPPPDMPLALRKLRVVGGRDL